MRWVRRGGSDTVASVRVPSGKWMVACIPTLRRMPNLGEV